MADLRSVRVNTGGYFTDYNPAIMGRRQRREEEQSAAANRAYVDSTNLNTTMRQGQALIDLEAQKQQANALQDYFAQPEATRGDVRSHVAPRIASSNPLAAMNMVQSKDQQDEANFKQFLDLATSNPQGALAFARERSLPVSPELGQLVSNTYFAQQMRQAFDLAQKQYSGRPDLLQGAMRKATAEIMGNMAASKAAGQPLPGQPMGFDINSMPTAPRPAAPPPYQPNLQEVYSPTTGTGQKGYFGPKGQWIDIGGTESPKPGGSRGAALPADAYTTEQDRLEVTKRIQAIAENQARMKNPSLWRLGYDGKTVQYLPGWEQAYAQELANVEKQFPVPQLGYPGAAPAAAPATGGMTGAPGTPYTGDTPPPDQPGAVRDSDGTWKVQQGGQWFMVVQ